MLPSPFVLESSLIFCIMSSWEYHVHGMPLSVEYQVFHRQDPLAASTCEAQMTKDIHPTSNKTDKGFSKIIGLASTTISVWVWEIDTRQSPVPPFAVTFSTKKKRLSLLQLHRSLTAKVFQEWKSRELAALSLQPKGLSNSHCGILDEPSSNPPKTSAKGKCSKNTLGWSDAPTDSCLTQKHWNIPAGKVCPMKSAKGFPTWEMFWKSWTIAFVSELLQ